MAFCVEYLVDCSLSTRGIKSQLTDQGAVLTSATRRMLGNSLELLEKAKWLDEDMLSYEQGLKRVIRIAGNITATTEFLPQRLAAFLSKTPNVLH